MTLNHPQTTRRTSWVACACTTPSHKILIIRRVHPTHCDAHSLLSERNKTKRRNISDLRPLRSFGAAPQRETKKCVGSADPVKYSIDLRAHSDFNLMSFKCQLNVFLKIVRSRRRWRHFLHFGPPLKAKMRGKLIRSTCGCVRMRRGGGTLKEMKIISGQREEAATISGGNLSASLCADDLWLACRQENEQVAHLWRVAQNEGPSRGPRIQRWASTAEDSLSAH